ncbi:MAG: response regulator [Myxococcaceae bacterium]
MARHKKPTLLAVDDKYANLIALDAVLGNEYDILFAQSGSEAISIVQKHPEVAVILLDVQMPIMDGFETATRIKEIPAAREIPIVFVTAVYSEDPWVKRGYEAGGIDYFSKPYDPNLLRLKVGVYASLRQRTELLQEREERLRRSEELLRVGRKLSTALDGLQVGVMIADGSGAICQTTDQAERILRSVDSTNKGAYGALLDWWESAGREFKEDGGPLKRAIRDGASSHNVRVDVGCIDGTRKAILVSAAPLRGLDSAIIGAVVMIHDLTEPARIGADLEDRIAKLVEAGVELEEGVARSHVNP